MKSCVRIFLVLFACALLAGCMSLERKVAATGRDFKGEKRFFVLRNHKDNHGIEDRIVRALRARGFEVTSGPATLQPDSAQVVIGYDDYWAWDFGEHMVMLKLSARDPQAAFPFVTASYVKQVEFSTDAERVVGQVVDELLGTRSGKK
jgi:hypothetical protein